MRTPDSLKFQFARRACSAGLLSALAGLSTGATAATLGNIGPGLGSVGPTDNYAHVHVFGKWILTFLMLAGRLEIYTVLILFAPAFWKK